MAAKNQFGYTRLIVFFLVLVLSGCATRPLLTTNGAGSPENPFVAGGLLDGWESIKAPNAAFAWQNKTTKSRILIHTSRTAPISYHAKVDVLTNAWRVVFREKFKGGSISLDRQDEIAVNGRKFHQAIWNFAASPMEGLHLAGKIHAYILKTTEFDYVINLVSVLGAYEKDRPVFENMLRSLIIQG